MLILINQAAELPKSQLPQLLPQADQRRALDANQRSGSVPPIGDGTIVPRGAVKVVGCRMVTHPFTLPTRRKAESQGQPSLSAMRTMSLGSVGNPRLQGATPHLAFVTRDTLGYNRSRGCRHDRFGGARGKLRIIIKEIPNLRIRRCI